MNSQDSSPRTSLPNEVDNSLWEYVQSLSSEATEQLSQPESSEVFQIIEHNIVGLLGALPSENFEVEINTNRDSLGRMLASAMISGYFLRNAEQRMTFEATLSATKIDS